MNLRKSTRLPVLAALGCSAYGLLLVFAMPQGLFSGDEGIKLVQSRSIVHNGWRSLAIPYPGADVDPEGRHFPFKPPFVWSQDGHWYGVYSIEYTVAAALAWSAAGLRGVYLLSWLGASLTLFVLARLAMGAVGSRWAALVVLSTAVGTPLLLYGTLNYEHTWGCAMVLWALTVLGRRRPSLSELLGAGVLLGIASTLRPELSSFLVGVTGFTLVLWGPSRRTVASLAIVGAAAMGVAGLHILMNLQLLGSFHPNLQAARHPATSYDLNFASLVSANVLTIGIPVLVSALVVGLTPWTSARARKSRTLAAVFLAAAFCLVAWRALIAVSPEMFSDNRTVVGLFTATPLAILGLLRGPVPSQTYHGRHGAACASAAIGVMATVVAVKLPGFTGGLELGSRYLLPCAPLLLLAAADLLRSRAAGFPGYALVGSGLLLLLLSLAATGVNMQSMHSIRRHSANLLAVIEASDVDDVIAVKTWVPQVLTPLYFEKRIYRHAGGTLLARLMGTGRRRVLTVHAELWPRAGRYVTISRERVLLPPSEVVAYRLSPTSP